MRVRKKDLCVCGREKTKTARECFICGHKRHDLAISKLGLSQETRDTTDSIRLNNAASIQRMTATMNTAVEASNGGSSRTKRFT